MKETKELLAFVLSLGNAAGDAMEDGKVDWTDVMALVEAVKAVGPALSGLDKVSAEWSAMTEAQKNELKVFVAEKFDIPQESLEATVENGMKLALDFAYFIKQYFKKG